MSIALGSGATVLRSQEDAVEVQVDVDPDAPVFAGHYPGFPLLPGVFTLDAVDQAVVRHAAAHRRVVTRLVEIRSARFSAAVLPGDRVTISCRVVRAGDRRDVTARCDTARGRAASFRLAYRDVATS